MMDAPRRLALSGQLLIRIISWSIVLVGAVTVLAFVQVYEHEKNHQLETVTLAATNKVAAAAKVFEDAEQTTQAFAEAYLAAYQRRDHQELLRHYADWVETTRKGSNGPGANILRGSKSSIRGGRTLVDLSGRGQNRAMMSFACVQR